MTAEHHEPGATPTSAQIRSSLQADRSPRNVRGSLPREDHAAFDAAYQEALRRAGDELDLAPLHECVESWRRVAILKADPADYARMMRTAEHIQHVAERGEPTGGISWDDAFTARLRARSTASE